MFVLFLSQIWTDPNRKPHSVRPVSRHEHQTPPQINGNLPVPLPEQCPNLRLRQARWGRILRLAGGGVQCRFNGLDFRIVSIVTCYGFLFLPQNVPTVISVLIPVGNSASYKFVLPATILVSWIGSMYLIYIIVKSGKRINKKLL